VPEVAVTEINADQEEASDQEPETDQAREAEEVQDVAFFEVENLLRKRAPVPFISVLAHFYVIGCQSQKV
jgi:hypothetical protein